MLAYDYVEAFAEKFRALAERTRPRDLYDVVNLYRNAEARPEQQQFIDVLRGNAPSRASSCHSLPTSSGTAAMSRLAGPICWTISFRPCCRSILWDALPEIFNWLHGAAAQELTPMPLAPGETPYANASSACPRGRSADLHGDHSVCCRESASRRTRLSRPRG